MTATLKIVLSPEAVEKLRTGRNVTLGAGRSAGAAPTRHGAGPRSASGPRAGSLPARVLAWAQKRGKPFGNPDVVREFGIKRGHASMELSKLANGARPIRRTGRGVYEYAGAPPRRRKTVKKRK